MISALLLISCSTQEKHTEVREKRPAATAKNTTSDSASNSKYKYFEIQFYGNLPLCVSYGEEYLQANFGTQPQAGTCPTSLVGTLGDPSAQSDAFAYCESDLLQARVYLYRDKNNPANETQYDCQAAQGKLIQL